jgi:predicted transcriptional regulator
MTTASSAKEVALRLIQGLPDDVTLEDIMYELYFRQHVDEGLKDAAAGRTIPHDEVKRNVAEWLRSAGR